MSDVTVIYGSFLVPDIDDNGDLYTTNVVDSDTPLDLTEDVYTSKTVNDNSPIDLTGDIINLNTQTIVTDKRVNAIASEDGLELYSIEGEPLFGLLECETE